jgi:hypothetical protein
MKSKQFITAILLAAFFAVSIPASHSQTQAKGHIVFGGNQNINGAKPDGACSGSGICDIQQLAFLHSIPVTFTATPINNPGSQGYYTLAMQIDIRLLRAYQKDQYNLFTAADQNSDAGGRYVMGSSYTLPQLLADELFPNANDKVILPKGLAIYIPTLPTQGRISIVLGTVHPGVNNTAKGTQMKMGGKLIVQALRTTKKK